MVDQLGFGQLPLIRVPSGEKKDLALGYALWCLSLVGVCGVQRLYLGQVGYGLVLLFTFGFCGVAQLVDLIFLPDAVNAANQGLSGGGGSVAPLRPAPVASDGGRGGSYGQSSKRGSGEDELERLLKAAEESVSRARQKREE